LKEEARTSPQAVGRELIKYVQEKKDRNKWIMEIEVVGEIPNSASGKILQRVLRDMAKKEKGGNSVVVKDERAMAKL
jgi:4-coumarate--CoA ligase